MYTLYVTTTVIGDASDDNISNVSGVNDISDNVTSVV